MFSRTLFTGFSPNTTSRDVMIVLGFLLLPWKWSRLRCGSAIIQAEAALQNYFGINHTISFDSGRSALYVGLKVLGITAADEVLAQAYTCVVVSNAIIWAGAKPVFVDILDDFTMDPEDVKRKITPQTKVLIIQHTFGVPARLTELLALAKAHNLKVIEDCAHSFGARHDGQLTGTFGDIGMLSFGSDKVLSSVRGGALITNDEELAKKIQSYQARLPLFLLSKLLRHLFHVPIFFMGKKLYSWGVGKWLLYAARVFHITNDIIDKAEKRGEQSNYFPSQFSNSLAKLALSQLRTVDFSNKHRQEIAKLYREKITNNQIIHPPNSLVSIFLRYPIRVMDSVKLRTNAKRQGIILGDWYDTVVAPRDVDLARTAYQSGSCPRAEILARESVNLPTDAAISQTDAERIIKAVNDFLQK